MLNIGSENPPHREHMHYLYDMVLIVLLILIHCWKITFILESI